ncbi:MAG TPA: hypoxanthine phosphoribosyltransferase [Desulfurivibrionaceae bacterium]|nr:hypoxanthine phosphoribosyltransferase [Desulfurivibrionaceae bacterium]
MEREVVISEAAIASRVRELGERIRREYAGRPLVLVGILNGAFIFTADLARAIDLPLEVDFIRVASYGKGTCSSGTISLTKDIELDIGGKEVLLVEDIVDTGRTLACLTEMLAARAPASLKICALIDKQERREVAVTVDYAGFTVADGFLVGYGLDCAERYRNLPAVYRLLNP